MSEVEALKELILKQSDTIEELLIENAEKESKIQEQQTEIDLLSVSIRESESNIKELKVENRRKDEINLLMAEDLKQARRNA